MMVFVSNYGTKCIKRNYITKRNLALVHILYTNDTFRAKVCGQLGESPPTHYEPKQTTQQAFYKKQETQNLISARPPKVAQPPCTPKGQPPV